ncbi:hypothetical protein [Oceanobacillus kimchii]|uniref:hypothetical protein n=1 Tax=Oceanobacillus kimchii TaxID=746691 RepID=UPI000986112F|nr:hypothetical protein [Oceanobacillus kimchii]
MKKRLDIPPGVFMLDSKTTKFLYEEGTHSLTNISPETYYLDQIALDREGNRGYSIGSLL